jgi:hypothetical protein
VLLPFVPMTLGLAWISLEGERAYADAAAQQGFLSDLNDQLERAGGALQSAVPPVALVVAAVALVAVGMVRRGVDWLSIGMLVVAFAFVAFAAESGVVASRYYLPALVLLAVVIARAAVPLGAPIVLVTGIAMVGIGAWQTREANDHVWLWVDTEQAREEFVREAAGREAGGCTIGVIGLNVEFVLALPVLMPIADEPPRDCAPGERLLAVIDPGGAGDETPSDDPTLVACAPEPEPVFSSSVGKILRCTGPV